MSWDNMTWNKVTVESNDQMLGRMYAKVWIQGKSHPPPPPPPHRSYLWTKLRPEGPKINFFETIPPPPYLKVWICHCMLIIQSNPALQKPT